MENEAGEDAEDGKRPGGDFRLEADENGKTGHEFEEACEICKRGCGRHAGTGDHAGRTGRIGKLAEAGIDKDEGKQNAGNKNENVLAAGHGNLR